MMKPQKVSLKEKIGYGFGDAASSMFWKIFTFYLAIFYTDGLEVGNDGKILPDFFIQARFLKLLLQNGIRFSNRLQTFPGDGSKSADTQPRTGKWLSENH